MIPSVKLWIAGTDAPAAGQSWSLRGVYTSEEKARSVCKTADDFYAPANVDDMSGDEGVEIFKGIVWPMKIT